METNECEQTRFIPTAPKGQNKFRHTLSVALSVKNLNSLHGPIFLHVPFNFVLVQQSSS